MTEAEKAYKAAEREIARVKMEGDEGVELNFGHNSFQALTEMPPEISELSHLKFLFLDNTRITDVDLSLLTSIQSLTVISLTNTMITDFGLHQLKFLKNVVTLWLNDTQISDAGLAYLSGLTGLQGLYLDNTQISDAGLAYLSGWAGLQTLSLDYTQISDLRVLLGFATVQAGTAQSGFLRAGAERVLTQLFFRGIPALVLDDRLREFSEVKNAEKRTAQTFAYLAQVGDEWPPKGNGVDKLTAIEAGATPPKVNTSSLHRKQIEFLINTAPATKAAASVLSVQISNALRDIPAAPNSNKLPAEFLVFERIRDLLEQAAKPHEPDSSKNERIAELEGVIAALKVDVGKLTKQLEEIGVEKSRISDGGFVSAHNEQLAKGIAQAEVVTLTTGVLYGLNYFLGPSSATIFKLIEATAKALGNA